MHAEAAQDEDAGGQPQTAPVPVSTDHDDRIEIDRASRAITVVLR